MRADVSYSLRLSFRPSFHHPSDWLVMRCSGHTELMVAVSDFHPYQGFEAIAAISAGSSQQIYQTADRILRHVANWEQRAGLDGIGVVGSYQSEQLGDLSFSFWSSRRNDPPHELVSAVFSGMESLDLGDEWNDYFEQLCWYFDFGLPVRLLEGSPAVLRISCGLSTGMEDKLVTIIGQASQCSDLIVDMRNFSFMGTMLLPCFAPLVSRTGSTRWLASPAAMEYLRMMRVPDNLIEKQTSDTVLDAGKGKGSKAVRRFTNAGRLPSPDPGQ